MIKKFITLFTLGFIAVSAQAAPIFHSNGKITAGKSLKKIVTPLFSSTLDSPTTPPNDYLTPVRMARGLVKLHVTTVTRSDSHYKWEQRPLCTATMEVPVYEAPLDVQQYAWMQGEIRCQTAVEGVGPIDVFGYAHVISHPDYEKGEPPFLHRSLKSFTFGIQFFHVGSDNPSVNGSFEMQSAASRDVNLASLILNNSGASLMTTSDSTGNVRQELVSGVIEIIDEGATR